jgi:4-hydroxy-tetrahydrodipicolinate reductase
MKLGVIGAGGRMGRMLVQTITETDGATLAAACEQPGSPFLGLDAGELANVGNLGVTIGDDANAVFAACDAVMEFSVPAATIAHARMAAANGTAHVIGTTGLSADDEAVLHEVAAKTAIVYAPNMSVVVNLMFALVEKVSSLLGSDYDIEIVEMHHKHKIDAPSGTAVGLGQAAARGRQVDLGEVAQWSREGETGARRQGDIGFATLRGGDVVGEHTVMFAAPGERMEITHRCTDRQLFARGGVRAAMWAGDKPPGLYTMKDILGLDV